MAEGPSNDADITRVYVSGIPPSMTSQQLRAHFSTKYPVTDAHVIADRRIGFVGFADHQSAKAAAKYFNKTFIRMSKIAVELARPVEVRRDPSGQAVAVSHRSQRRHDQNRSEPVATRKRKRDIHDEGEERTNTELTKPDHRTASTPAGTDVKRAIEPVQAQEPELSVSHRGEEGEEGSEGQDAGPPQAKTDSDDAWLRGKTSRLLDLVEADELDPVDEAPKPQKETSIPPVEVVENASPLEEAAQDTVAQEQQETLSSISVPNGRLFVRNLPFDTSEDDLRNSFAPFGRISEVSLITDMRTSTGKGLGYVQFVEPSDAAAALVALDGKAFRGRLMHVLPALDKKSQKLNEFEIAKLPLKKQKALKRKADAAKATFSWNSLYMNPDAVLASVADRLGVSKSDVLDPTSSNAAVKQAHAETSIIKETKDYLSSNGVNIDAFRNSSRDERTLLLKNFPFGTTMEELSQMLSQHGAVSRLLFPPTGTMAIAQFQDADGARLAMKNLSYRNLKGFPLYLEKGPDGVWTSSSPLSLPSADKNGASEAEEGTFAMVGTTATLFVRNLNFSTTSNRLSEAFNPLPGFLTARVKTRTDARRSDEILSMGFGFVEFRTKAQADAAIATMNGRQLDGHSLVVQASHKATDVAEERRKEDINKKLSNKATKIIIKNLPFEATKKDISSLFGVYGQLRTVRLPKKFNNTTRGFAFAEFVTAKEAQNAMQALSSTHLLGRRLVLDFAESESIDPEAEIRAMEKKVQDRQNTLAHHKMAASSRKKFNVGAGGDADPL